MQFQLPLLIVGQCRPLIDSEQIAIESFSALFIMTNPGSSLSALFPRFLRIPHFEDQVFSVLKTAEYFWIFLSPFQQPRSRSHCTDDRNFFLVRGVQFINWLVSEFG